MRKLMCLFMIFLLIFLVSCDPSTYYFSSSEYADKIEKIELIKYNNEEYKLVDPSEVVLVFDITKVEKIEELDENKIEEFLNEFEQIVFHIESESVKEPTGYCLLWHLKNGNFIVFSCTMIKGDRAYSMVAEFDLNGNFIMHHVNFAARPHFEEVLKKYFKNYQI